MLCAALLCVTHLTKMEELYRCAQSKWYFKLFCFAFVKITQAWSSAGTAWNLILWQSSTHPRYIGLSVLVFLWCSSLDRKLICPSAFSVAIIQGWVSHSSPDFRLLFLLFQKAVNYVSVYGTLFFCCTCPLDGAVFSMFGCSWIWRTRF